MKLLGDTSLSDGNPTVPIRWCMEPEDLAYLKERKAQEVQVLLAIVYQNGQEDRQLLPLESTMTYVSLRYPGKAKVLAKLFWYYYPEDAKTPSKRLAKLKEFFLERSSRRNYQHEIVTGYCNDRENLHIRDEFSRLPGHFSGSPSAELDIDVPKDYFAPEPKEWVKRWGNLIWPYPPIDQCEFRRRKIFAFTLQPIGVLAWLFGRAVAAFVLALVGLLCGFRGIDWSVIWHPWRTSLRDTLNEQEDKHGHPHMCSVFFHDEKHKDRSLKWLLVNPIVVGLVIGLMLLIAHLLKMSVWKMLGIILAFLFHAFFSWVFVIAAVISAIIIAMFFGAKRMGRTGLFYSWGKRILDWYWARVKRKDQEWLAKRDAYRNQLDAIYKEMQCSMTSIPWIPKLAALPKERRTLRLYYLDVKRRVCKPFAG